MFGVRMQYLCSQLWGIGWIPILSCRTGCCSASHLGMSVTPVQPPLFHLCIFINTVLLFLHLSDSVPENRRLPVLKVRTLPRPRSWGSPDSALANTHVVDLVNRTLTQSLHVSSQRCKIGLNVFSFDMILQCIIDLIA